MFLKKSLYSTRLDTARTEEMIREENPGRDYKIVSIGIAGEKRVRLAAVINDWVKGRGQIESGRGNGIEEPEGTGLLRIPAARNIRQRSSEKPCGKHHA